MNDQKIIAAIQEKDSDAISAVMDQYSKLLWYVVSPILRQANTQDVEECVADVFIDLWLHPEKYDPQKGSLKTWLSIRARCKALDRCRELGRKYTVPLEETELVDETDLAQIMIQTEEKNHLDEVVEDLPEAEREILIRRYYVGQKPGEIAQALHLPLKSVENRLYRAKQKLKKKLRG